MNIDNSRKIIFILDDDVTICSLCKTYLTRSKIPCDVYTFTEHTEMLNHPEINNVSLFILDVLLGAITGPEVCKLILEKTCIRGTFLFISGSNYSFEEFEDLNCTYDFIQKPFLQNEICNRCKLLLNVSSRLESICEKTKKIELGLWDVFNYSNIYLLILDDAMNIKLCSYMLATDLGFESEDKMIGENWKSFLPEDTKLTIDHIHDHIIKNPNSEKKEYQELTNDIITKNGKLITVRWFNTCINNGIKLTFSIGIPLTKDITKEDNIETLRAYWSDKINKDRVTINAFRDLMKTSYSV